MPAACASAPTSSARVTAPDPGVLPLVAVALGFVMAMLDVTVVNVALPHMRASLGISLDGLVWVVDGYTLTFAALLLVGGALANRYGARTAYMAGLTIFVTASLLCGMAPSGGMLIAARLAQGIGAALFMPSSLSLLVQTYIDESARIKVFGLWSAFIAASAAMGPVVGGLMVGTLGWRSIFWINVPIGLVGLVLTLRHIAPSPRRRQMLNPIGHALGVTALAALAFALIEGASYGWTSTPILGAATVTVAAAAGFVLREQRYTAPIVPKDLFRNATFPAANVIGFLINLGAFGQLFLFSLFLPQVYHTDAWHTGIDLLPLMAVFAIGNLVSGRISARWGLRLPMLWGMGTAGIISVGLIGFSANLPYPLFAAAVALSNLGVAIAIPAMTTAVMQVAGQAHANIAAAALNANRQVGTLIGVAAMGAILHMTPGWSGALPAAYVVIALVYVAAAVMVRRYMPSHPRPYVTAA